MTTLDVSEASAVDGWLDTAIATIDERFGVGHAKANPALVAGYMQACAGAVNNALMDGLLEEVLALRSAIASR